MPRSWLHTAWGREHGRGAGASADHRAEVRNGILTTMCSPTKPTFFCEAAPVTGSSSQAVYVTISQERGTSCHFAYTSCKVGKWA